MLGSYLEPITEEQPDLKADIIRVFPSPQRPQGLSSQIQCDSQTMDPMLALPNAESPFPLPATYNDFNLMHNPEDEPRSDGADLSKLIPREREQSLCPCKSRQTYAMCCLPFHQGKARPETAEQLMRSRYSAYFFRLVDYLVETTHPDTREPGLKQSLEKMIHQANWSYLTILGVAQGGKDDKRGKVEFVAEYYVDDEPCEMHEVSRFKRFKGAWKYLDRKS